VLGVVGALQIAGGLRLALTSVTVSRDLQFAAIWSLVVAIALFVWVTGGADSPYNPLFVLAAGAVGGQGPRRAGALAVGVTALIWAPLVYGDPSANDAVRFLLTGMLAGLFMGFVTWIAREIREERIHQRAATESAVHLAADLRRLDEAKDRFIGAAAHELRSPLSVVLMHSDELLSGEAGEITGEQRELLEITKRSAARLDRIVADLLDLAQMDAGAFTLRPTDFLLGESISQLCDELAATAAAREVRITRQLDGEIAVRGDRPRLEIVLANVISNAVKYSHDGGEVRVGTARRGDYVVIEVADDGVGIPEGELGRVGERFFRAATALGTQGTGLGLAIAREVLDLHSASLEIASREGLGTTVVITLPMGRPQGDPAPTPRSEPKRRRRAGVDEL
jgi:signal transduction histidine kinase